MVDIKNSDKKVKVGDIPILGILLLLAGIITSIKGKIVYQAGYLIPPTTKSGWMTGPQAMIIGAIMIFIGIGLIL